MLALDRLHHLDLEEFKLKFADLEGQMAANVIMYAVTSIVGSDNVVRQLVEAEEKYIEVITVLWTAYSYDSAPLQYTLMQDTAKFVECELAAIQIPFNISRVYFDPVFHNTRLVEQRIVVKMKPC